MATKKKPAKRAAADTGLFKHEGVVIVGRHVVAWEVYEPALQITGKPRQYKTRIWTTAAEGDSDPFWDLPGDHSKALERAVNGR